MRRGQVLHYLHVSFESIDKTVNVFFVLFVCFRFYFCNLLHLIQSHDS